MSILYFLAKILITAAIIAAVSELAKHIAPLAAILASLPLTSILAILWLYVDTSDTRLVADLSKQIFWALLPSLLFFLVFPALLKTGLRFSLSLALSIAVMLIGYAGYVSLLRRLGIPILK